MRSLDLIIATAQIFPPFRPYTQYLTLRLHTLAAIPDFSNSLAHLEILVSAYEQDRETRQKSVSRPNQNRLCFQPLAHLSLCKASNTGVFPSTLFAIPSRIKRKENIDGTIRLPNQDCNDCLMQQELIGFRTTSCRGNWSRKLSGLVRC